MVAQASPGRPGCAAVLGLHGPAAQASRPHHRQRGAVMISDSIGDFIDFIIGIGPWAWATGVLLVVVLALAVAFVKTRRGDEPAEPKRERHPEDILTIVAAGIATAVSAQGMWQFFERVLGPGT